MSFQIYSALSTAAPPQAMAEVVAQLKESLPGPADLVVAFYSNDYQDRVEELSAALHHGLSPGVLMGCQGESIVGREVEVEQSSALSVWAAQLPGVALHPLQLRFERTAEGGVISGWPEALSQQWPDNASMIVLGDPFSFPADLLVERMADDHPDCVVAGGMASGSQSPGQLRLLLNDQVLSEGAAAVLVERPARIRCVVSQGCRPIGQPLVVTKAERNLLLELGGLPALEQLESLFRTLPNHEQAMAQQGLHIGRVINEYQESFEAGDFLIRNVMGIDPESNAIAASDYFRVGQTVQFHLRDEQSADAELRRLLERAAAAGPAAGGLLFTCNGRGTRMFQGANHDAACVEAQFPGLPLAGLFAQGEIGPIGGRSFMHGFTASLALIEDEAAAS